LTSLLQKLLVATGLVRRGNLVTATQAIQQALGSQLPASATVASPVMARVEPPLAGLDGEGSAVAGVVEDVLEETMPVAPSGGGDPEGFDDPVVEAEEPPATGAPRRRPSRFVESSYTAASGTRTFKLFEPAGFEDRPVPLIVMLHGCTQDPDDFAAGTRMNTLASERGLFVLYPAQAPRSNAHKCWNWFMPGDQRRGHGEPALIAGMVRHVMQTHTIDADRVYVAGLSAGGAMAAILAREYPDVFAAAGVHSGLPPGAAHDVASAFSAMKSGQAPTGWAKALRPMPSLPPALFALTGAVAPGREAAHAADAAEGTPLIVFHGDADQTVNVANGARLIDAVLGTADWQAERVSGEVGGRTFTRTTYRMAHPPVPSTSRAEHWLVHGASHAWSAGDPSGSFTEANGPDASVEMLRFFEEHPGRRQAFAMDAPDTESKPSIR